MKLVKLLLIVFVMLQSSILAKSEEQFTFRSIPVKSFKMGEELKYRVHYGWINAASVKIKVDTRIHSIKGRPTYKTTAFGSTYKTFDWAFKVRDYFESFVDTQAMAPLKYYKTVEEDDYRNKDLVYFDHEKEKLSYVRNDKPGTLDMPTYVQDVVSAAFYARTLDFSNATPGKTFPLDIYLDQKVYNLKFKYIGKETISADVGKVRCLKFRPQLVVDRVFKDEDDMTIWISDDANKIPIRVQTDIWVGSLKVDLKSYKNLRILSAQNLKSGIEFRITIVLER